MPRDDKQGLTFRRGLPYSWQGFLQPQNGKWRPAPFFLFALLPYKQTHEKCQQRFVIVFSGSQETVRDYVQLFQKGKERGFNFFYKEYYDTLCYFSFKIIKDKLEAEGIVAEAFTKLWERHSKFDNLASIRSFLYTTIRNSSLNWLRKQKNESKKAKELAYLNQENERTIADKLIEIEFYRELFATLKSLPPHYRNICEMLFLQAKNYEQISKELKVPESTIRTQKARALLLIRKLMFRIVILIFTLLNVF